MKRKQALSIYLAGTLGQILLVSLIVLLLRAWGLRVDYGSPIGLLTLMLGGVSSAESIWPSLVIKVLIILLAMRIASSGVEKVRV